MTYENTEFKTKIERGGKTLLIIVEIEWVDIPSGQAADEPIEMEIGNVYIEETGEEIALNENEVGFVEWEYYNNTIGDRIDEVMSRSEDR